jgi:phosphonate transport system ATP-binding protein
MALVEFRDESAGYNGRTVLSGITLRIEEGERIALVGESGAGKSTLLRLIYERCRDDSALVPQELGLVQALTVFHNVYMGRLHRCAVWHNLRNLLWPARADVDAVRNVLVRLRLEDKLFAPVGTLSGGQQQRTAVARALYHPGNVFIADEPVSSVDEHQAREILDTTSAAKRTVILAMHDRSLAIRCTDRLIGLKGGRIVLNERSSGIRPTDLDHLYRASMQ